MFCESAKQVNYLPYWMMKSTRETTTSEIGGTPTFLPRFTQLLIHYQWSLIFLLFLFVLFWFFFFFFFLPYPNFYTPHF